MVCDMQELKKLWNNFVDSRYFVVVLSLIILPIFSTLFVLLSEYILG